MQSHAAVRRAKCRRPLALLCLLAAISLPTAAPANDNWNIGLGAGVVMSPAYTGADDTETRLVPTFDVAYRERVFFNFYEGVSAYFYKHDRFSFKAGIGFGPGRDSDDDESLAGMPDIDTSTLFRLSTEYRLGRYTAFVTAQQHYGGTDGGQLVTGIQAFYSLREQLAGPLVLLNVAAVYSDEDYMNGFFGVDEEEARTTTFPAYVADAGVSSARAGVTYVYPFSRHWRLTTTLQYSRLVGDAADSPLVLEDEQVFGGGFFSYRF